MSSNQTLPPPILRPTARPTEPGRKQNLWDRGFEIEQMRAQYEAEKGLELIGKIWDCSAPFARKCIVLAGGTIRRFGIKPKMVREFTEQKLSPAERKRRADVMRANQAKGVQTRNRRIDAFADDTAEI